MDQDAFRKLVASSTSTSRRTGASTSRGLLLPSRTGKKAEVTNGEATKPEFKPRKVNKGKDSSYRDRAAERRQGVAGDFAEAEALLENFEKQHADDEDREAVEEKRRYLGGDSEHTVLVKGLDFALLEQARAREAAKSSLEDEELLENAFHAAAAGASQASEDTANAPNTSRGKKRTREDIIRELKEKRGESVASEVVDDEKSKGIEERKQEGKFKPIGFKPVGGLGKKAKEKDSVKKKKRKVDADTEKDDQQPTTNVSKPLTSTPASKLQPSQQPPEPINDDDIFADAGEYEGLNLEDDDEDDGEEGEVKGGESSRPERAHEEKSSEAPRKWIDDDDEMAVDEVHPVSPKTEEKGKRPAQVSDGREDEDERESERAVRLAPLQSSAVPSIRDILAADAALEAQEMRKARKEKRKAGGGEEDGERGKRKVSAETKLNREIKKLKAYTEKKDK